MRGGWVGVESGGAVVEAVRMERVPRNCTPDLMPENDGLVCLRIHGAWHVTACEVVSCHGTGRRHVCLHL
jgi:hypothetical protein